jgi:multicomponent Na+:H+ antiporter subunit D
MTANLPSMLILLLGALLIPILKGRLRSAYLLALPVITLAHVISLPEGQHWTLRLLEYTLVFGRIDKLSLAFAYIFILISFIGMLYALHVKDDGQQVAVFVYAGGALGAVFAGDLLTLFIFWELMAVAATFIIWSAKTKTSGAAGFRYLLVHLAGGVSLLVGIVMHVHATGSLEFGHIGLNSTASYFILLGFGVNAAFPILHAWLPDAYPEATFSGAVFLSSLTTKTAVYVLARSFAGTEVLIWIGAAMTAFPIFYAVIENNLRRVLSYSLINQVGFMVAGIGIGTTLALNGTVAHAFSHILYKSLLFMSMGAVLHQTGRINATDLGGLYRTMPLTTIFCIIGAASISGFPLFSGFVSKSMIVTASGMEGLSVLWFFLLFASAGVFHHSGIKIPFFAFFSHDSGLRPKEPPFNMLLAMGIAAFLCVFIGVFPGYLYRILPFPVAFFPYTGAHVIDQLQILFFSALAFTLLIKSGIYPAEIRAVNLDADWFYRKGAKAFVWALNNPMARLGGWISSAAFTVIPSSLARASRNPVALFSIVVDTASLPFRGTEKRRELEARIRKEKELYPGDIIRHLPIGWTVLWTMLFLLLYITVYYLYAL